MKHSLKKILAICGVVLLLVLYGSTLVFALLKKPWAYSCLQASVFATIVIPVILYAVSLVSKNLRNRSDQDSQ